MITATDITFDFSGNNILSRVSLSVQEGEIVSILGRSGSGKTTLLKLAAGLLKASSGSIEINGGYEYLSQSENLFPYLTAKENLLLPLRIEGVHDVDDSRLTEILQSFDFRPEDLGKFPHQMSGGMQQKIMFMRVFLLNGITNYLLDEPYTAIDEAAKKSIASFMWQAFHSIQASVLIVTHDIEQAISQSDRIIIIKDRGVKEIVVPAELARLPPTERTKCPIFKDALIKVMEAFR